MMLVLFPCTPSALRLAPSQGRAPAGREVLADPWDAGPDPHDEGESLHLVQVAALRRARHAPPALANASAAAAERAPMPRPAPAASVRTLRRGVSAVQAAKGEPSKASQVKCIAALSMLAVLAFAFRSKVRQLRQVRQVQEEELPPAPISISIESCLESTAGKVRETKAEPVRQKQPFTEMAEVPPPMRRLRNIGASYVIPRARIARCSADSLSFDIPTLPCVWPLRAQLSRPSQREPWARIQLTVDIIAASGLPPLLTCARTGGPAPLGECGGTGGTGSPAEADVLAAAAAAAALQSRQEGRDGGCSPWLSICNAGGTVVATILRRQEDGALVVQRQDRSTWDIDAHLGADAPWITISKQGQEMGQATSLGRGREEHLQLDTQPDVQSPESCVLLMCMLAVLVFKP